MEAGHRCRKGTGGGWAEFGAEATHITESTGDEGALATAHCAQSGAETPTSDSELFARCSAATATSSASSARSARSARSTTSSPAPGPAGSGLPSAWTIYLPHGLPSAPCGSRGGSLPFQWREPSASLLVVEVGGSTFRSHGWPPEDAVGPRGESSGGGIEPKPCGSGCYRVQCPGPFRAAVRV